MPEKPRFPVFAKSGSISREFLVAFSSSGSDSVECTCCGRVFFCSVDFGGEEEELDSLLESAKRDPERYIDGIDCASWFRWGKLQVVIGCPCHFDVALENKIWTWGHDICEYLVARSALEKDSATRSLEEATKAASAISTLSR